MEAVLAGGKEGESRKGRRKERAREGAGGAGGERERERGRGRGWWGESKWERTGNSRESRLQACRCSLLEYGAGRSATASATVLRLRACVP